MTAPLTRYPGESAVAFANRRLRVQGRTDVVWIQTAEGMRLQHVRQRQGKLDV